jgi:hypothetical protein
MAIFADVDGGMGDLDRLGLVELASVKEDEVARDAARESACFSSCGRTLTADSIG